MKVMVVGSGGREHAIAWALRGCSIVASGRNAGLERLGECYGLSNGDIEGITKLAVEKRVDIVVVGPEEPLVKGLANRLEERKIKVFGPTAEGAILEGSKVFAKQLMKSVGIPTANFEVLDSVQKAHEAVERWAPPYVLKADGLAAGKGTFVVESREEAHRVIEKLMVERIFGEAGNRVVLEEFLEGEEYSLQVVVSGDVFVPLVLSQDHKRAFDGDKGPNTGGMGAYAPLPHFGTEIFDKSVKMVIEPLVSALCKKGIDYRGVIYAGMMLTKSGPYVLEFNCRFGDPEIEAILPLLESDFLELVERTVEGQLQSFSLKWKPAYALDVVLASGGYPGSYKKGFPIKGVEEAEKLQNVHIFFAGVQKQNGSFVTSGGRVLNVVGVGSTLKEARDRAYKAVSKIQFENMHFRRDIGWRAL